MFELFVYEQRRAVQHVEHKTIALLRNDLGRFVHCFVQQLVSYSSIWDMVPNSAAPLGSLILTMVLSSGLL